MGESVSPLGRDILSCFVNRRTGAAGIHANLAGATSLELCENRRAGVMSAVDRRPYNHGSRPLGNPIGLFFGQSAALPSVR
jgi:hypothetical protein